MKSKQIEKLSHPQGVQPYGVLLYKGGSSCRNEMGQLATLQDEQLLQVLSLLDASSLGRLGLTCKAMYCFSNHEELWRTLVLEEWQGDFSYKGSWKATYLQASGRDSMSSRESCLKVSNLYSDLLYQPFHCAAIPLKRQWLDITNIDRQSNLSLEDFQRLYEKPNQPVIITDVVPEWKAYKKWNADYFRKVFRGTPVTVGDMPMEIDNFLEYAKQSRDDMPLYLFDKDFVKRAPQLASDYQVPQYFSQDLFSVLGEDRRPDYRWLIMGPNRSGSSFHKDPNSTSAWNAVVTGAKKWILFPPNVTPPGVVSSEDGANVATSVSLVEWFLNFYEDTQELPVSERPRECICQAGELLFVPRGWWHMVLNLEESIAVTQNFVTSVNLPHVLRFLASRSVDLISGCPLEERSTLHQRFTQSLRAKCNEVLDKALQEGRGTKRKAAELSTCFQACSNESGFKFSFAA